jgi:GT2 family glycosyltransferase
MDSLHATAEQCVEFLERLAHRGSHAFQRRADDGDVVQLRRRLARHPSSWLRVVAESALGLNIKRNRGIAEARGELLLFTDDDCVPDPRWVATMAAALARRPIVTGAVAPLGAGVRASLRERSRSRLFHGWFDTLLPWRAGCGNNLGMRRDIAQRLGAFEPRIGVGTWSGAACDTEFLFRALRAPGIGVFYEPAAIVRHRQAVLGPAVLDKRRRYYRGLSFMARRIHPDSPTVWMTAMLRLFGTASLCLWSGLRIDRDGWQLHRAELRGAWEGFFPPAVPGPAGLGPLGSNEAVS